MKNFTIAIIFLFSFNQSIAQSINFTDMDGVTTAYNISDVQKIVFGSSAVILYLNNDDILTFPFDEFKNYQYSQETLSTSDVLTDSNEFKIFPNPTEGDFKIGFDSQSNLPYKYRIYDMSGKAILEKNLGVLSGPQTQDISLEEFPSGVYIIELKSGNLKSSQQLIKQ